MTAYYTKMLRVSLRCDLYCFSANSLSFEPSDNSLVYVMIHLLLLIANRRMVFTSIESIRQNSRFKFCK